MKNHIARHKHHYLRTSLVFCLLIVAYFVTITVKQPAVSYAIVGDSQVGILITGYNGSLLVTSSLHSFGTCNSAPGQTFSISGTATTICYGYTFGYPGTVTLALAQALPSGYHLVGWVLNDNRTDGSVSCSVSSCSFNFSSGTTNVYLQLAEDNPYVPPTAPSLNVSSITAASAGLSWSSGSGGSLGSAGYKLYKNNTLYGTYSSGVQSLVVTGLGCSQSYQFYVQLYGTYVTANSNVVPVNTSACPAPPPAPAPPPPTPSTRSSQPTSSPSIQGGGGTSSRVNQSTGTPSAVIETAPVPDEPPGAPKNFRATPSGVGSAVELNWDNDVKAVSYKLERSTDNTTWKTLDGEIADDSYVDSAANFDTIFYYRLTAVDDQDRSSEPTVAQAHTNKFQSNAGAGKDLVLKSPDGALKVVIPVKALTAPASCSFASQPTLPLYGIAKYEEVYGPYQLICQQENNTVVNSFSTPLSATLTVSNSVSKKYTKYSFAGFDASDRTWRSFSVAATATPPVITFKLAGSFTSLTIHGQPKRTSIIVVVLAVVGGLIVAGGLGVIALRKVAQVQAVRRIEAINEDYWHKMNGV